MIEIGIFKTGGVWLSTGERRETDGWTGVKVNNSHTSVRIFELQF